MGRLTPFAITLNILSILCFSLWFLSIFVTLNILSILCFSLWFLSIFVTLRDDKKWKLQVVFSISSLFLVLFPLVIICPFLRSTVYANFWGISKDEPLEKTWDYDLVSDDNYDFIQVSKYMLIGIAVFLYAWTIFAIINNIHKTTIIGLVAILSSTLGGFCVGELFKVGPTPRPALQWVGGGAVDFGFFKYVVANSVCSAQRLFGFSSKYMWVVFSVGLFLLSIHNSSGRHIYVIEDDQNQKEQVGDPLDEPNKNAAITDIVLDDFDHIAL